MCFRLLLIGTVWCGCFGAGAASTVFGQSATERDSPVIAEIRESAIQLTKSFNAGKAEEVAGLFIAQGELIDEEGAVYHGQQEIKDLLTAYFTKYPGAKSTVNIESIRLLGPIAIEEGTRETATQNGENKASLRYIAVRVKTDGGWRIASLRDFSDDPAPTPHEMLLPLAWMVGDWVNEGKDAIVKISYRWSEDENYLLADYLVTNAGKLIMKSSQRIGWDPLHGKVRSWLFDSDGGFGEGTWTHVEDGWVIKSSAVLPDGQTASATVTLEPIANDRFVMKGTERIVGDAREDDFEFTVTKRPPSAAKAAGAPKSEVTKPGK